MGCAGWVLVLTHGLAFLAGVGSYAVIKFRWRKPRD